MSRPRIDAQQIIKHGMAVICEKCSAIYTPTAVENIYKCPNCGSQTGLPQSEDSSVCRGGLHPYSNQYRGERTMGGKRIWFANRMEANYYRYLLWQKEQKLIANFQYQPNFFDFRPFGYDKGVVTYKPDFLVVSMDGSSMYVELKGHISRDHKTKMSRMRKCFPGVRITVVTYSQYKQLEKDVAPLIKGWEK